MKTYITWQTFWLSRQEGRHIDSNVFMNWNYKNNPITCKTLGLGNASDDKRQLAIIEIPEDVYNNDVLNRFWRSLDVFASEQITPTEALNLCNEWYSNSELIEGKTTPFELDEDEFTLIDNRLIEDMDGE